MIGPYFSICSLFFIIIFIVVFFSKKKVDNVDTKAYGIILIITLLGIIFDVSCFVMYKYQLGFKSIIYTSMAKLEFIYYSWWLITYWYYMVSTIYIKRNIVNLSRKLKTYNKIIIILMVTSTFLSLILPCDFQPYDGTIIPVGISVNFSMLIGGLMVLIIFITAIMNLKYLYNKKFISLFILIFAMIMGFILQQVFPDLYLLNFLITIVDIIMFFTIENPDVKMIEQLEIAKESADKANNAKSEFLSNMSHEIRTPLNAIVGFSESLKDDNISPESMEKVNDIIMASNNLLDIVNGILDISKIEANKLEIIEKEYNIQDILDELIVLTKARIGDKGLEFKVSIDPSLPAVLYGDCTRVKQVILNILTNAVKYTKQGWVDFKVSSVIKDNVCRLIISVEDSGIGIKEESLPKLFSKFDRLNVEKEMTIEGTGLGLAITKKLIELMNGKIIVQSVYGQGSKFTISIDQRIVSMEKPAIKETKVSESKIIDAHGAKILLVDDNALNIKVASTLLQKYNFNIDSANSGQECIDKINQGNQYDIVFLDDMMPKMSGREVIKKLKENPSYKIPTVALTANAIDGMKEEYLSIGFDDYLSKPIEKLELERVIKKYLHNNNVNEANSASGIANSVIDMTLAIPRIESSPVQNKISYAGKKILLVDDNELNLKVEEMSLKKYGFEIIKVTSGSDAIAKVIENNNYDLVLLDDMMPNLDGPKTLDSLKEIDGYKTPTVLLTASSYDEVKEKIDSHGFNGYLGKPLKGEELDKLLKELLN